MSDIPLQPQGTFAADGWDPALAVGNATLDAEHRTLIGIIHRLRALMDLSGEQLPGVKPLFDEITAYTVNHFSHEEALMRESGYYRPDEGPEAGTNAQALAHLAQHKRFIKDFEVVEQKLASGDLSGRDAVQAEYQRLNTWLVRHIKEKDQLLANFLRSREQNSKSTPLSVLNRI